MIVEGKVIQKSLGVGLVSLSYSAHAAHLEGLRVAHSVIRSVGRKAQVRITNTSCKAVELPKSGKPAEFSALVKSGTTTDDLAVRCYYVEVASFTETI